MSKTNEVAIIMGSDSDWKIMKAAKEMLDRFEVGALTQVVSAHRTPGDLETFAKKADADGIKIIIAGAGGAAHLPGMMAAFTILPVIGVPINATSLNGMDALLSIVQMPLGIPVATVAIENAGNAALLALRMLGIENKSISQKLRAYRDELATQSRQKTENLK
jgi:5-(carboxyamino)imidazole ribonucleotide mutase